MTNTYQLSQRKRSINFMYFPCRGLADDNSGSAMPFGSASTDTAKMGHICGLPCRLSIPKRLFCVQLSLFHCYLLSDVLSGKASSSDRW